MREWIDIGIPLRAGMPQWPGDPALKTWKAASIEREGANVTALSLCAHTGTHVDAPLHYFEDGMSVDRIPLGALIGPARVVELDGDFQGAERVLFKTRNSLRQWWLDPFTPGFDNITPEHARCLTGAGVRLAGIDSLSIGADSEEGAETHRILLKAGVVILEGLNLCDVSVGEYELICLPLKLEGADGAPARALLRRLDLR
jgi:arylformamidase